MHYVGNILTDVTIAMHDLSKDWGRLQIMYLLQDELVAWAKGEDSSVALGDASQGEIQYLCAVDGMIHAAKGTFGLRIDGVDSVSIDSMIIENIVEHGDLGYEMCGLCLKCAFEARTPYQIGYAGNMAQGISADYATNMQVKNLFIKNVESKTGRAVGFSVWPGTTVSMEGDIVIQDIKAGADVKAGSLKYSSRPNAAPEACAIRVYDSSAYDETHNDNDFATVTIADDATVTSMCVIGHTSCWDSDVFSQVGDYKTCKEAENMKTEKKLINISSRIHTAQKNNHLLPVVLSASVILLLAVLFYSFSRCTQNKKLTLLKLDAEKVPLMQYGSMQN
jgi:predicted transcriptional regulator